MPRSRTSKKGQKSQKQKKTPDITDGLRPPPTTPIVPLWLPATIDMKKSQATADETLESVTEASSGQSIASNGTNITDPSTIHDHNTQETANTSERPSANGHLPFKSVEGAFTEMHQRKDGKEPFDTLIDKFKVEDMGTLSLFKQPGSDNQQECGICYKAIQHPKLLPCFHSFCMECLNRLMRSLSSRVWMKCPLCKSKINIPKEGAAGFLDNNFIRGASRSGNGNLLCDICNDKTPLCRCTDCSEYFCSDCTVLHLKMETSKTHTIVNLANNREAREETKVEKCPVHNESKLDLYCVTCSKIICGRCGISKHVRHIFEDIETVAKEKRSELTSLVSEEHSSRLVRDLEDHVSTCLTDSIRLKDNVEETIKAIQAHIKKVKQEFDAMGDRLIKDLKSKQEIWEAVCHRKVKQAETKRIATSSVLKTAKEIIDKADDIELIQKHEQLKSSLLDLKKDSKPSSSQRVRVKFVPIAKSAMCGRLKIAATLKKAIEFYPMASVEFQKQVNSICATSDGNAWVAYRRFVQLLTKDGTGGGKIDIGEPVIAMVENSNGAVYMACKTNVKVMTNKTSAKSAFSLPHEPSGMAINEDDELILCFRDAKRVAMYTTHGKHIKDLDLDHLGFRFGLKVNDPWKVAVNENQDICVTDYSSEHVAVYGRDGSITTVFRSRVRRYGILACHEGLVYIADYKKDRVSLFSEDGQLLQEKVSEGIPGPMSIALDRMGDLWLGSWTGKVKVYGRR